MYSTYIPLNRTLCDVLEEMRKCYETRNFGYLPGLIEEAQSMGNRMEAKLGDLESLEEVRTTAKLIQKKVKLKKIELEELNDKIGELKNG